MSEEIREIKYIATLDDKHFLSSVDLMVNKAMVALQALNDVHISINLDTDRASMAIDDLNTGLALLASTAVIVTSKYTVPLALLMASITGVGYAIYDQVKKAEEAKAFIKVLEDEVKAFDNIIESGRKIAFNDIFDLDKTKEYINELEKLIDAEGNIIGNKDYVLNLVDKINGMMPNSIKMFEDERIEIENGTEALKDNIEMRQVFLSYERIVEEANIAQTQTDTFLDKIIEAKQNVTEYQSQVRDLEAQIAELDPVYNEAEYIKFVFDKDEALKNLDNAKDILEHNENLLEKSIHTMDTQQKASQAIQEANYESAYKLLSYYFKDTIELEKMSIEELVILKEQGNNKLKYLNEAYGENAKESIKDIEIAVQNSISEIELEINNRAKELGEDMINGSVKGIEGTASRLANALKNAVNNAMTSAKNEMEIHSPSRKTMKEIGEPISEGIAIGIDNKAQTVIDALVSVSDKSLVEARKKATSYREIGSIYLSNLRMGIDEKAKFAIDSMQAIVDAQVKEMEDSVNSALKNSKAGKFQAETAQEQIKQLKDNAYEMMKTYKETLKNGADEAYAIVSQHVNAITAEAQAQYDEIIRNQESMKNKLSMGSLFTYDDDGNLALNNIKEEIKVLEDYETALSRLKDEKNLSNEFLKQITELSIEEGTGLTNMLLGMLEGDFDNFVEDWEKKQNLASEISQKFYEEDLLALEADFEMKLEKALDDIPDIGRQVGEDTMAGVTEGLRIKGEEAIAEARRIADAIIREMQRALDINSPSKKASKMVGAPIIEGVQLGMENAYDRDKLRVLSERMLLDISSAQATVAHSVQQQYHSLSNNSVVNNEGSLIFNFDKMVNSGEGTATSFMKEMEFIRRKKASAVGGV